MLQRKQVVQHIGIGEFPGIDMAVGEFAGQFHIQNPGLHYGSDRFCCGVVTQHLLLATGLLKGQFLDRGLVGDPLHRLVEKVDGF